MKFATSLLALLTGWLIVFCLGTSCLHIEGLVNRNYFLYMDMIKLLLDLWSLMNFTLTVSIGVTAKMASQTPAPRPHNILKKSLSIFILNWKRPFQCQSLKWTIIFCLFSYFHFLNKIWKFEIWNFSVCFVSGTLWWDYRWKT